MKKLELTAIALLVIFFSNCQTSNQKEDQWNTLFDGTSLDGWQAAENEGSFYIEDSLLVCHGPRAHLFYQGNEENYKNFELSADVMTKPGANSGIYFHTAFQEKGWPAKGYEVQVNNSHKGTHEYRELKKTGSLYAVRNLYNTFTNDNEWFNLKIKVEGKRVTVQVNDQMMVDYIEPANPVRNDNQQERILSSGTFALQSHDPESKVYYKNIKVKKLPDNTDYDNAEPYLDEELNSAISHLHNIGFPLMDLHVHLKGDLTLEKALDLSRKNGINYGIAINSGLDFPINTDEKLRNHIQENLEDHPVFKAMQAEGREWTEIFSPEAISVFDYVFTDAMTFNDLQGNRMHLWMPEEVHLTNKQLFMDALTDTIVNIIKTEPIDVYANATYLPDTLASEYNELWTQERMEKITDELAAHNVAFEISARYKIPNPAFIKMAKAKGVKFTFGTNNTDSNLGNLAYCLEMIEECKLVTEDMFIPEENRDFRKKTEAMATK